MTTETMTTTDAVAFSDEPIVRLRGVSRTFGDRTVLKDVDLDIHRNEFVALLGHSGTGKSTLLRIISRLDREADGEVAVPEQISIGFQEPRLLPWKKVWKNVVLGLREPAVRDLAYRSLAEVGLLGREEAWPATLSGGEAQRASLARALARRPELLVLDEPFGALDALTKIRMRALLLELCRAHRPGVLLVTHDVEEAILLADRILVMSAGELITDIRVDLPHPRERSVEAFAELRTRLLADLGVEESA